MPLYPHSVLRHQTEHRCLYARILQDSRLNFSLSILKPIAAATSTVIIVNGNNINHRYSHNYRQV